MNITFDTLAGSVRLVLDELAANEQPMYEFEMTPETGEVIEIVRHKEGNKEERVRMRVDPSELILLLDSGEVIESPEETFEEEPVEEEYEDGTPWRFYHSSFEE